jgi:hypothetical protein
MFRITLSPFKFTAILIAIAFSSVLQAQVDSNAQDIYFVTPASNTTQQAFIRFTNTSTSLTADVTLEGIDDEGNRGQSTITFSVSPLETIGINSEDLEYGNESKGLTGFFNSGVGNWRVIASSTEEIVTTSYLRTSEGFTTIMGGVVPNSNGINHVIQTFNPASNINQVSKLRIVNTSTNTNTISIAGIDDDGNAGTGTATITLGPEESTIITSQDIENGLNEVSGGIGDGARKWQLVITSSETAVIMNLLEATGGYISNLSRTGN